MPTFSRRALTLAAVIGLMASLEAVMLLAVRQESQTADEAHNLLAGYLYLTAGDFSAGSAHPPLAKDVGALPLLILRPHVPPMPRGDAFSISIQDGRRFLYSNRAGQLLFAARAAMTVFPLLLGVMVFLATREMFGPAPALIALTLTVFEPNILAHGPLATNDVALAACLFATVYAFWRYVVNPGIGRLALTGVAGGLTLASKHSGLLLFPILFLLALGEWLVAVFRSRDPGLGIGGSATGAGNRESGVGVQGLAPAGDRGRNGTPLRCSPSAASSATTILGRDSRAAAAPQRLAQRLPVALAAVAALSVGVLWAFYGFRYAPVADAPATSLTPLLAAIPSRSKTAVLAAAVQLHLLPLGYLAGVAHFLIDESRPTFLLGTYYGHGVWFYFPVAFVIKSTLGFFLLLVLAPFGLRCASSGRREIIWMLIPVAVFLAASMTSRLNIGVRYILPIYPFLTVLMAAAGWALAEKHWAWRFAVGGLVLIHTASSLRAFPNYLSYSNELWGGPAKTYRVLTDSNVDWGQGLPAVKRYLQTHAAAPCWLAYFGTVDPAYYGIPCPILTVTSAVIWERPLDEVPPVINGTVLVSATEMSGQAWGPGELNPYDQFRSARPVACLAGSILVYRGSFRVPLASALSRLWKVVALANQGKLDAALAEAQAAEALAPHSVDVQFVLGRVLKAAGRSEESRQTFETARRLAQTIHPETQSFWIPIIQGEMNKP